jgi:hypothetical protein
MKNLWILCLLISASAFGQTMKWIPFTPGSTAGSCTCAATHKDDVRCYILEYTPGVTGTLTTYTTGFMVSCTSLGSAIVRNESCSMKNNTNIINGCNEINTVLFNSSGNSGVQGVNKIEAGKPVLLHQVCFNVPKGETINVIEDETTDLTTSIDRGNGDVITEFPDYETLVVGKPKYDDARPTEWLDFKANKFGEQSTQLFWTVSTKIPSSKYIVEHAVDGVNFKVIGEVTANPAINVIQPYQFTHAEAAQGFNYYRLQLVREKGGYEYSPVRQVTFGVPPMIVRISPNPAIEYITVDVSGHKQDYEIRLLDIDAKLMKEQKVEKKVSQTRLTLTGLASGVYTVQVRCGDEVYAENIMVTKS